MLDVKLKRIVIDNPKFDKDGEMVEDKMMTLTITVPIDTVTQEKLAIGLIQLPRHEFLKLTLESQQLTFEDPRATETDTV